MAINELREYINRILGDNMRTILPSFWWKRLFNVTVDAIEEKQDKLVAGVNIKTLNGKDIVGEGDVSIGVTSVSSIDELETMNSSLGEIATVVSESRESIVNFSDAYLLTKGSDVVDEEGYVNQNLTLVPKIKLYNMPVSSGDTLVFFLVGVDSFGKQDGGIIISCDFENGSVITTDHLIEEQRTFLYTLIEDRNVIQENVDSFNAKLANKEYRLNLIGSFDEEADIDGMLEVIDEFFVIVNTISPDADVYVKAENWTKLPKEILVKNTALLNNLDVSPGAIIPVGRGGTIYLSANEIMPTWTEEDDTDGPISTTLRKYCKRVNGLKITNISDIPLNSGIMLYFLAPGSTSSGVSAILYMMVVNEGGRTICAASYADMFSSESHTAYISTGGGISKSSLDKVNSFFEKYEFYLATIEGEGEGGTDMTKEQACSYLDSFSFLQTVPIEADAYINDGQWSKMMKENIVSSTYQLSKLKADFGSLATVCSKGYESFRDKPQTTYPFALDKINGLEVEDISELYRMMPIDVIYDGSIDWTSNNHILYMFDLTSNYFSLFGVTPAGIVCENKTTGVLYLCDGNVISEENLNTFNEYLTNNEVYLLGAISDDTSITTLDEFYDVFEQYVVINGSRNVGVDLYIKDIDSWKRILKEGDSTENEGTAANVASVPIVNSEEELLLNYDSKKVVVAKIIEHLSIKEYINQNVLTQVKAIKELNFTNTSPSYTYGGSIQLTFANMDLTTGVVIEISSNKSMLGIVVDGNEEELSLYSNNKLVSSSVKRANEVLSNYDCFYYGVSVSGGSLSVDEAIDIFDSFMKVVNDRGLVNYSNGIITYLADGDTSLSETSSNPIQNKVVTKAIMETEAFIASALADFDARLNDIISRLDALENNQNE